MEKNIKTFVIDITFMSELIPLFRRKAGSGINSHR